MVDLMVAYLSNFIYIFNLFYVDNKNRLQFSVSIYNYS